MVNTSGLSGEGLQFVARSRSLACTMNAVIIADTMIHDASGPIQNK